jgi:GTP-binding protein EngB required for normal cell division
LVVTKTDKLRAAEHGAARGKARGAFGPDAPAVSLVSGETGEGVDALWATLVAAAGLRDGGPNP